MKVAAVLAFAAGAARVSAIVGAPICMAACTPLLSNPIAYTACMAGCATLAVSDAETESHASPRFLPDGTVVFEKQSPQCAEACKALVGDQLAYSACLGGCSAVTSEEKK